MVTPFTTKTLEVITPLIKDFGDEIKDLFSKSLEEYLKVKTEKFEEIKTLLHREIPVKFYDIYQPTKLKCEKCDNKIIETINVKDIFQKSKLITVIGNAGSGKSTLIKHLFLNTIKTHFSIPILIELRHLNNYEKNISDYLVSASKLTIFSYKYEFILLSFRNIMITKIINKLAKFIDGEKTINCHKELTRKLIEYVEYIITNINQKIKYIEKKIVDNEKSEDDLLDLI